MLLSRVYEFGPHVIPESQVFYKSKFCIGLVNLKPIVPGHVLIVSRRNVPRVKDLRPEEVADIMISAQTIGTVVEKQYQATSLTTVIQDGPEAGQSVAHVHMHVIPRKAGDWANNDDIYDELSAKKKARVDNEARKPRSAEEMRQEAEWLRTFFPENYSNDL
ncbi:fragile histidine triad protein [Dichotomocladium elegans]|nr:fragile histidine triad protein [Dichotomocladium elegans]